MTATPQEELETPVLIVGGGPVGLTLALDLAIRGIRSTLVERDAGTAIELLAKAGTLNERTMEYCRWLGISGAIASVGFPDDHPRDTVYCTSLNGFVLGRDYRPSTNDRAPAPESPEILRKCPQFRFDPLLAKAVQERGLTQLMYGTSWLAGTQDADGVTSTLAVGEGEPSGPAGKSVTVRSKYLVACDGAGSAVRRAAGIGFQGKQLDYSVSAMIEVEHLERYHPLGRAERYMFIGTEGTWANLTAVDGRALWRLTLVGSEERLAPEHLDFDAIMRRAMGSDRGDWKVRRVMPWRRSQFTADRFAAGRILLAGDAAHTTSPTGGHGLNTGLGDVSDLGWMLGALLRGWGGGELLAAYDAERRPVAIRNGTSSTKNYGAWVQAVGRDLVLDDTPEGEAQRRAVGDQMNAMLAQEWHSFGVAMGYRYDASPIVVPDGTPPTPDDPSEYVQTARPGHRAPHAWLPDGRSTIDLFGDGFTLLTLGFAGDVTPLTAAAASRGVPLRVVALDDPAIARLYERRLILVRPDGMVAWRSDALPDDASALIATVTGNALRCILSIIEIRWLACRRDRNRGCLLPEVRFDSRWKPVTSGPETALSGDFPTLQQLMDAAAVTLADREAYVDGDQRVTFAEWMARADLLAAEFQRRGVRRGDVVALMLPPSVDYAVCYAAAAKAGAITTGLNTRIGRREVDAILGQCSPALVVRDASLGLPDVPAGTPVLDRSELKAVCDHLADVPAARAALAAVKAECEPTDLVTIMWTSGTTGLPKGACFDHANLRAISAAAGAMCAPGDRRLGALPFAHAGYMGRLWDQLEKGITLVICAPGLPPADMVRLVAAERITVFGAVPTQWERLLRQPDVDDVDLSHVRVGTSASAPIRPEVVKEIAERLGFPLIVRYAMTESPTISGTEPEDPPDVQFRTVGRPQAGMEVSVAAPPGEVGQIRIRGGCVMRGYWNAPELTAAAFDDEGWLVSGDLGYLREDGNLAIVGRASDMYIRGGYNIYPAEVEAVLALHPKVASVSVVGVPAPRIGEIGVAFVVPADQAKPPTLEELRETVRIELSDYKAPDRLEIIDRLPVNAMMKVDKKALRAQASASASASQIGGGA